MTLTNVIINFLKLQSNRILMHEIMTSFACKEYTKMILSWLKNDVHCVRIS